MKKIYFAMATLMILSACNKKENTETVTTETTDTATVAPIADSANTVPQTITPAVTTTQNTSPQIVATPQITPSAPAATAPGMNPPHGQPNHRCDIPVGAPLSSPPQNTVQPATVPQTLLPTTPQNTVVPQPTAAPVATAPGMNPPHGEPGHKCEIPVGAPLNQ